jgi:hypothetical protein
MSRKHQTPTAFLLKTQMIGRSIPDRSYDLTSAPKTTVVIAVELRAVEKDSRAYASLFQL